MDSTLNSVCPEFTCATVQDYLFSFYPAAIGQANFDMLKRIRAVTEDPLNPALDGGHPDYVCHLARRGTITGEKQECNTQYRYERRQCLGLMFLGMFGSFLTIL